MLTMILIEIWYDNYDGDGDSDSESDIDRKWFPTKIFLCFWIRVLNLILFFFKRTLNVGIGAVGLILVAYGCLGLLHSGSLFLGLSMLLRWETKIHMITIFFNRLAWIDFDLDFDTFQGAWGLILTFNDTF